MKHRTINKVRNNKIKQVKRQKRSQGIMDIEQSMGRNTSKFIAPNFHNSSIDGTYTKNSKSVNKRSYSKV